MPEKSLYDGFKEKLSEIRENIRNTKQSAEKHELENTYSHFREDYLISPSTNQTTNIASSTNTTSPTTTESECGS